jgi:hypothetical protein
MNNLKSVEQKVMSILLDGDEKILCIIRLQERAAVVSSREMTGVGFYSNFSVPPHAPRIEGAPSFTFGGVDGAATNVRTGLGFVLFVTDRLLDFLEGYTYDEPWPDEVQGLTLTYSGGASRDMDNLRRALHPNS